MQNLSNSGVRWAVLTLLILMSASGAKAQSLLLSDFPLTSDGSDALGNSAPMQLSGVSFDNHALVLPASTPYTALATINGLSYNSFTVAVDFKPTFIGYPDTTILSAGPLYRWFGLGTDQAGHLEVILNNFSLIAGFTNIVQSNEWHTVVCAVDLTTQTIVTFLDGQHLTDLRLQNFQFEVVTSPYAPYEKAFSFWNYADADNFTGSAANLRVYSRALRPSEIAAQIFPALSLQVVGNNVLVYWPLDTHGYLLEETDSLGSAGVWKVSPTKAVTIGDQQLVIENMGPGSRFYRLIKKPVGGG